jgi:UDP-GlcNAc:undecaprenyl-phosphate/decaprenyl-phosphate GlcNAc-1-phosphate transferase
MTPAALLRHLAFFAGLALLSACVVRLMIAARLMDTPEARKSHDHPTPKGGGVGILTAFLVGIAITYEFATFARLPEPYFEGVLEGTVAIALVAFLDDLFDWPFAVKLAAQVLAAAVVVQSGLYVRDYRVPYFGPLLVGWLGPPATIAWLLFTTNAVNFIDGLNGLAGGVALISCVFLAVIAATHGGWFAYFACLLLAAGLAGFLPFNFPRARIFMGDVGSQFCGFMLAVLAVVASRFEGIELSLLLMPMLLSGVLFDVAFTLCRRALAGARLTEAHRGHLYQVAQRSGVPATWIALTHWGFAALGGACSLVFITAPSDWKPYVPLLSLLPQAAWVPFVAIRARQAGIGPWR